jgi:DNA-binding SARP family transcriptional activator
MQQVATPVAERRGEPPRAVVRLSLLNGFELRHGDTLVRLALPAQRLVAFLALQEHAVLRSYVASTLWLDSTEERAFGSLRSALWRLRQADLELVEVTSRAIRLDRRVGVDLREAVIAAHRALAGSGAYEGAEVDTADLAGELLPDWYDDWIVLERERFRELRVRALECLCERHVAAGRYARAMEAALQAVRDEPLRESAHRSVIAVHLAEGNQVEALRRYDAYRRLLHGELGLEPSGRMTELLAGLTAQ